MPLGKVMSLRGQKLCFLSVICLLAIALLLYSTPKNLLLKLQSSVVKTAEQPSDVVVQQLNEDKIAERPTSVKIAEILSRVQMGRSTIHLMEFTKTGLDLRYPMYYEYLKMPQYFPEPKPAYPVPFERRFGEKGCYTRKPVVSIAPWQRVKYRGKKWRGLQLPVIVIADNYNTGNFMGNYATVYALGRAYNATVRIPQRMHQQFSQIFPNLTVPPIFNDTKESDMKTLPFLGRYVYGDKEAAAAGLLGPHVFYGSGSPIEIELFHAYSCELRKEFTFSPEIQEKVRQFWLEKKDFVKDAVRVGFHIRRREYIGYVRARGEQIPNETYYNNAMNFYKERFSKVVFIVSSGDRKYIRKTFENYTDVTFVPGTEFKIYQTLQRCKTRRRHGHFELLRPQYHDRRHIWFLDILPGGRIRSLPRRFSHP
ncbi:uncharacterized protein LOC135222828 isoform X3 [Macrobrachium nipponense]|uniref:uncharacterized protein LOC135222828 isoform X3 n=1 Tax=Macrobrachium nipponense TaxID=159736 RepID=UPI0030C7EA92